jgi:hypothetical protein
VRARSVGELASARWWRAQGAPAPPEPRADALRDLFAAPPLPPGAAFGAGEDWPAAAADAAAAAPPFRGKDTVCNVEVDIMKDRDDRRKL